MLQLGAERVTPGVSHRGVLAPQIRKWCSWLLSDLAVMHKSTGTTEQHLRDLVIDYHVYDWYHNELTGDAFEIFRPSQLLRSLESFNSW